MVTIKDLKISQLNEYINSDEYKNLKDIPISPQRALSNINNPKGDKDDKVLFLAYDDDKFIGYLGAISDIFNVDNKTYKVAWLSCMWVDHEYRRQGIAVKLLNHANIIWNSNLLITNYIPSSGKTFEKTGIFTEFKSLPGIRGYLRFNLAEIIILKKPELKYFKWLISLFDFAANIINEVRLLFWKASANISKINIEYLHEIDDETNMFIRERNNYNFSPRDKAFFDWIKKYPWVLNTPFEDYTSRRYEFSAVSKNFNQLFLKVMNSKNQIVAFIMLTYHGSHLKTPYLYFDDNNAGIVRKIIYGHLLNSKVKTFTTYHPGLVKAIKSKRNPFISVRKMYLKSIISKDLLQKITDAEKYTLMEGDGDCAFV